MESEFFVAYFDPKSESRKQRAQRLEKEGQNGLNGKTNGTAEVSVVEAKIEGAIPSHTLG